ncbi:hypothetical protein JCM9140_1318 [Halalkalibacter wakoensis JCM 9140]|uniref:HNH endonuclease n=1 Tax=Halalkalibacter wakoensis JCM 9140 TaxID=1236970 RepID=W4Q1S2_9BACI|nr:HNH endonuclease [Halalkalibacter wakoensis]GAE25329.1 hypothetical protein JCM9140_1318 [Halalkalibacter wakoensis JCM 9140]
MKKRSGRCQLCDREGVELTVHHLTPKEEGGTFLPTAELCIPCHKQIHAVYTNKEIATRLFTLERLKDDEQVKKFLTYIQKQPPQALIKTRKSKSRR